MNEFCTYFDSRYLLRGLALYSSMRRHLADFTLRVLCLDDLTYSILTKLSLPGIKLIALSNLEEWEPRLTLVKKERTLAEYYFTCTPVLPAFILAKEETLDHIFYLDADLYFFSALNEIEQKIATSSIVITPHRFSTRLAARKQCGTYNVGLVGFRRDAQGLSCLATWKEQCLEWCFDRFEEGKYADQGYLDRWPSTYSNLCILQSKGVNLAPWNIGNYEIKYKDDQIWIDGERLIFYHFHGLKLIASNLFWLGLTRYGVRPSSLIKEHVYLPYLNELYFWKVEVLKIVGVTNLSQTETLKRGFSRTRYLDLRWTAQRIQHKLALCYGWLMGDCIRAVS